MKKAILLVSVLSLMPFFQLFSVNHMDLIQTMTGEFNGSEFGFNMASIDFNADGFDDLVVSSSAWNPNGVYNESQLYGKLYFYWGGPNFDNVPDMVIPGAHYLHYYGQSLFNAGDINGDGLDDLVLANRDSLGRSTIEVFYGRLDPHTTPDVVLTYPQSLTLNVFAFALGDINGDGHADLGYLYSEETSRYGRRLLILTDISTQPLLFREIYNNWGVPNISGVGDVNNDGFDDFYTYLPINGTNSAVNNRLVLYYGSASFPVLDSLVISNDTQSTTYRWGCPVGDVNGDNIDDFIAYQRYLWLGGANLTSNWNVNMDSSYGTTENFYQYTFQHGDFNNDGFEDVVSTNSSYGGNYGIANIWMGRSQMNGTVDLNLWHPFSPGLHNFGLAKAVGDFNGDGFDDVAISAPWWGENDHTEPGKVFVFSGNAQLADTTVGIEDESIPLEINKWQIQVYPNPYRQSGSLIFEILSTKIKYGTITIFNLKGQIVKKLDLYSANTKVVWNGRDDKNQLCSSGVYFYRLSATGYIETRKFFIIK